MYRICSASRSDVISTEVYQGLAAESVPSEEWITEYETESLDDALDKLLEYKSVYKPGKLTEYFIAEEGRIIKYASGLFTRKGKKGFIAAAAVIVAAFILGSAFLAKIPAVNEFVNTYWLYGMLVILIVMLVFSTVRDKNKKKVKRK